MTAPRDTKTLDEICQLKTDNVSTKRFWLLIGEDHVTIAQQENGERAVRLSIPRADFNKLVDWYHRDQPIAVERD